MLNTTGLLEDLAIPCRSVLASSCTVVSAAGSSSRKVCSRRFIAFETIACSLLSNGTVAGAPDGFSGRHADPDRASVREVGLEIDLGAVRRFGRHIDPHDRNLFGKLFGQFLGHVPASTTPAERGPAAAQFHVR